MGLARGTGLRLGGQLVGGLASIAVLPLVIRHLGVDDFGRYVSVLAVIAIAVLASDVGLTGIALRESAVAGADRRSELLAGLFGLRLAVASVGACAAVGFAVAVGYDAAVVAGTAVASLGLFPQIYADMVVVSLVVDSRFAAAAGIETTRSVGSSLLLLVLVLVGAGLFWFLAAWGAAALLAAIAAHSQRGDGMRWPRPSRAETRRVLSSASGYALATGLHVVYFRVVMLVVAGKASAVQAGWFGAGFRITEFAGAAAGQAAGSATPTLARSAQPPAASVPAGSTPAFAAHSARIIGAALALGAVVAAGLAIAAPLIMRILGGDALEHGAAVLRIQAIAVGLMFPSFATGAALFALHRHRDLVVANGCALVAAVVLAFALVPAHEARGGAAAAAIAEAILFVCSAALLVRALRSVEQPA